jgi:hypothetical protein
MGGLMPVRYWNNNTISKTVKTTLLLSLSMILSVGCAKEPLKPLVKTLSGVFTYGQIDAHFCTSAPNPAKQKIKYLFIIDHSSSNQPGFPLTPTDFTNTDSNGARRYGPLVNFVRNLVPDPNNMTAFNMIDFNTSAYQPGAASNQILPFESDSARFILRAQDDWIGCSAWNATTNRCQPGSIIGTPAAPRPLDANFTDYAAALNLALTFIRRDAQEEAILPTTPIVTSAYHIIFVTDGLPEIPSGTGTRVQDFNTELRPIINNMKNLKFDPILGPYITGVTFNTAFYFNLLDADGDGATDAPIISAQTLLQQMADEGNGQFLQFGAGAQVLYQQFAPPSRYIHNQLIDVLVENKNGLHWDNGEFMLDTDGEGLPDGIEYLQGSNVNVEDSDGNGVSDLVEFRTKGRACDDVACGTIARDRYAICAGFTPVTDAAGNVTFASSSNDGLNDCEKYLLNANRLVYNTNGNFIPDEYGLKMGLPITRFSGDQAFVDPFGDGLSNYEKIKLGLPIQVSMNSLLDFEQRYTHMELESSPNPDVNCFHLTVEHIALASVNSTMRVMIIQNGTALQDKPFLMQAEAQLGQNATATFSPGDFQ